MFENEISRRIFDAAIAVHEDFGNLGLLESGWFDRNHLPEIPLKGSIARAMIDAWLDGSVQ